MCGDNELQPDAKNTFDNEKGLCEPQGDGADGFVRTDASKEELTTTMSERLTLRIEGAEIEAGKFELGVRAFLQLIRLVARDVSGAPHALRWLVDVRPGSAQIDYVPKPLNVSPALVGPILDAIMQGIAKLEAEPARPEHFSDAALKSARQLASIGNGGGSDLDRVTIRRGTQVTDVSTATIINVRTLMKIESKDEGTIEGRLEILSERRGFHTFVYDPVTDKPIRCRFEDDDIANEAVRAFGRRVAVTGLIRYRATGEATSIEVEEFEVFPPDEELPHADAVRGILGR